MPSLDEKRIHDVLQLNRQGMKWRAIARALTISRNTVRQIVHEHAHARQSPHCALPTRPRSSSSQHATTKVRSRRTTFYASRCKLQKGWPLLMRKGSCIATSSQPTSYWRRASTACC